jgi:hypothetical protein
MHLKNIHHEGAIAMKDSVEAAVGPHDHSYELQIGDVKQCPAAGAGRALRHREIKKGTDPCPRKTCCTCSGVLTGTSTDRQSYSGRDQIAAAGTFTDSYMGG